MADLVHPTAIIEDGVEIGRGTRIWGHVHVRAGARIGRDCIIGEKTYIAYDVRIGDLCKLNAAVYVCAGVTIDDGCIVAAHVVFTNDVAPRATDRDITRLQTSEPTATTRTTRVGRGASIGANATIGPGADIGAYAMVGMGSVVTRPVPPHGLVIGNPARLVGLVARDGTRVYSLGPGESLPHEARVPCPGDGHLEIAAGTITHHPD